MKKNEIFRKKALFFVAAFAILAFSGLFSCNHGLGVAVDLQNPEVKIETPKAHQGVPRVFNISGIASDNSSIKNLCVTLVEAQNEQNQIAQWIFEKGVGRRTFGENCENEKYSWQEKENKIFAWEISSVEIEKSTDYRINVVCTDDAGNSSVNNADTTRTVTYDSEPPKVEISFPKVSDYSEITQIRKELNPKITHKEKTMVAKYINCEFSISGTMEENFKPKSLKLRLDKHPENPGLQKTGETIYEKNFFADETSLNEAKNNGIKNCELMSLRSFKIALPDFSKPNWDENGAEAITEKTYIQILTQACDNADNKEILKSHGFFCYWPQSDEPWAESSMIGPSKDTAYPCYPSVKVQGEAFDDDGIKEIKAQIDGGEWQTIFENEDDSPITMRQWQLNPPSEMGTYALNIKVTDINGKESAPLSGFFRVKDINDPKIKIISPDKDATLFGNQNGDFTFEIEADDDSGVEKIAFVYIKNESSASSYLNSNFEGWNDVSNANQKIQDSNGNLLYWVQANRAENKDHDGRKVFTASYTLNIFSDLKVDGENVPLDGKRFVFFVEDNNGNKTSEDFSALGDIEAPELKISSMKVVLNATETTYQIQNGKIYLDGAVAPDFSFSGEEKISLSGKWSEDSFDVWKDKNKFSYNLTWNETDLSRYVVLNENGTWTCDFDFNPSMAAQVVSLVFSATDFAKNSSQTNASFAVQSDSPYLMQVTAENASGAYGSNKTITILLKLNKNATVSPQNEGPKLILNNGREAVFDAASNNSSTLKFTYTVSSGDASTSRLNVESINLNGATIKNGSTDFVLTIPDGKNLSDNKQIAIVTEAPSLKSASIKTGGADGDIFEMEFTTPVTKGNGLITITQTNVTNVPAVLSETEFNKWKKSAANLATFYTKSTNGTDSSGNADLSTKYVLNYEKNSNDAALLSAYTTAKMHEVKVSVMAAAVKVGGEDKEKLLIDLKKFPLPCKGAAYKVQIDAGIVKNIANEANAAQEKTGVQYAGVEAPVIRVQKGKAAFNAATRTATQPLNSKFKIDCETPNAQIQYGISQKDFPYNENAAKVEIYNSGSFVTPPTAGENPSTNVQASTPYSSEVNIGSSELSGQKFFIKAEALKDGKKENGYEMAKRSVFVFDEEGKYGDDGSMMLSGFDSSYARIWLRGGDAITGGVTTAGFPLSWDDSDKNGIALLTKEDSGTKWSWVTWELTTTAYVGVIGGIADANSETQGPEKWSYGVNSWVPFKEYYCVFPGESRYVHVTRPYGAYIERERGTFGFVTTAVDRTGGTHQYDAAGGGGAPSGPTEYTKTFSLEVSANAGDFVRLSFSVEGLSKFKQLGITSPFNNWDQVWENDGITDRTLNFVWISENAISGSQNFTFTVKEPINGGNFNDLSEENFKNISVKTLSGSTLTLQNQNISPNWNEILGVLSDQFTNAKANSILVVKASVNNFNQMQTNVGTVGSWHNPPTSNGVATCTFALSENDAQTLKTNGLTFGGAGYTVNSVTLYN